MNKIFFIPLLILVVTGAPLSLSAQDPDMLIANGKKTYQYVRNSNDLFTSLSNKAKSLNEAGEIDEAILKYQELLKINGIDSVRKMTIYAELSGAYEKIGNFEEAIAMHRNAVRFATDSATIAKLSIPISTLYISLQDYEQAMRILNQVISFFEKENAPLWIAVSRGTKAIVYKAMKDFPRAIRENMEAYKCLNRINMDTISTVSSKVLVENTRSTMLNNIADIYLQMENNDSAYYYLEKIKDKYDLLPEYVKAGINISYAEVYTYRNEYTKAIERFHKGLKIAEHSNFYMIKRTAYLALAKLYKKTAEYKKAAEYQDKYIQINEEITSSDNIHKINQLQNSYALEKKDKEITRKELQLVKQTTQLNKRRLQTYFFITSSFFFSVIIILLIRNMHNRQKIRKEEMKNTENEKQIVASESIVKGEQQERSRIALELHDNVVSELMALKLNLEVIKKEHPQLIADPLFEAALYQSGEITENLRRTTHNMMPAGLEQTGLIKTIEAFINKLSNENITFYFQSYGLPAVQDNNADKITVMIIHELIQNIIKHSKATEAIIQLNYFEDTLSITIEDNGIGIANNHKNNTYTLGWRNIRRNIAILEANIDVQSSENSGTTIFIEIPTK